MVEKVSPDVPLVKEVFVYGTLKRGHGNHRLLEDEEFVREATVEGKLFGTPYGWPCAEVPENTVLMQGTSLVLSDVHRAGSLKLKPEEEGYNPTELIRGEVYRLSNPNWMNALDRLEGFRGNKKTDLFDRILVPLVGTDTPVWMYVRNAEIPKSRIESGNWTAGLIADREEKKDDTTGSTDES